jgi:hypothetical protein
MSGIRVGRKPAGHRARCLRRIRHGKGTLRDAPRTTRAYADGMSEPAPELDVEDALRGEVNQLIVNGQRMPVIVPGSVIDALQLFAVLLQNARAAGRLPSQLSSVMPWIKSLPERELWRFADDLAAAAASREHAAEHVSRTMLGWRATAEVYSDPGLLAALKAPAGDYGPVPEPAE